MKISRQEFLKKSIFAATGGNYGLGRLLNPEKRLANRRNSQTGIKISVFSKHLQWMNYKNMANAAAKMGFDGVDLTVRPGGHVLPENLETDLPKAVEAVRSTGLEVYTISTSVSDPDKEITRRLLKVASQLNIRYYRTDWFDYNGKLSMKKNFQNFRVKLRRLADLNKHYGIYGDYQNHSGTNFGSAVWDLWDVLSEINSPWIGSQYDIRHATVEGAHSWPVGLKAIHPFIGTLDIKDFHWEKDGDSWRIRNVPLGEGQVDFTRYFKLLKQYDVRVPITIHNEYDLGGAEHGNATITIPEREVIEALQNDLQTLRKWIKRADLR